MNDEPPPGGPADCWYIFHTAADERVCPECGPLDGAEINGSWTWLFPPLHSNCRCWLALWYCESPDDPLIPPPDPPGPGPF
jgi:hypothetical protein